MSIYTWQDEFLPISAEDATESDLVAAQHALLKWSGALPQNLKKHGVNYSNYKIFDSTYYVSFDAGNCALCKMYLNTESTVSCVDKEGNQCPFYAATKAVCPFHISGEDARLMVKTIKKVIKYLEKKGSNGD